MRRLPLQSLVALLVIASLVALVGSGLAQAAEGLALPWWTADGGRNPTSRDRFSLNDTVGQPDASAASGGAFTLTGGFWTGGTIQSSSRVYLPLVYKDYVPCEATPTLLSPANGSHLNTLTPTYRWDAGSYPNATGLSLLVALDPQFQQVVQSLGYGWGRGLGQFRLWPNLAPATRYYWRAQLACGQEWQTRGPYTQTWSFTSGSGGTLPPTPVLVAPANNQVLSSTEVTLKWAPVSGASEYLVFWQHLGGGRYAYHGSATEVALSLERGATYEWWVQAWNDYGLGDSSPVWRFSTPSLSSARPAESTAAEVTVQIGDNGEIRVPVGRRK